MMQEQKMINFTTSLLIGFLIGFMVVNHNPFERDEVDSNVTVINRTDKVDRSCLAYTFEEVLSKVENGCD